MVGSTPWNALVFMTLYFQLSGMSDWQASCLVAVFAGSNSLGCLVGGVLGDLAATRLPNHGRILVTQFSVASGIPLAIILFKARILPF